MCIIIGDVHKFTGHCLIPLDPWLFTLRPNLIKIIFWKRRKIILFIWRNGSNKTGKIYYNTGYIIECSDENGENLTTIGQVLPRINDITIDQNNIIYVATEQGIYKGDGNNIILSVFYKLGKKIS